MVHLETNEALDTYVSIITKHFSVSCFLSSSWGRTAALTMGKDFAGITPQLDHLTLINKMSFKPKSVTFSYDK